MTVQPRFLGVCTNGRSARSTRMARVSKSGFLWEDPASDFTRRFAGNLWGLIWMYDSASLTKPRECLLVNGPQCGAVGQIAMRLYGVDCQLGIEC